VSWGSFGEIGDISREGGSRRHGFCYGEVTRKFRDISIDGLENSPDKSSTSPFRLHPRVYKKRGNRRRVTDKSTGTSRVCRGLVAGKSAQWNLSLNQLYTPLTFFNVCDTYFAASEAKVFEALHNHLLGFAGRKCSRDAEIQPPDGAKDHQCLLAWPLCICRSPSVTFRY